MRLPWQRHREEAEAAAVEAAGAERKNEVAERRRLAVHRQAEQAEHSTKVLQAQLDLNGWTELLQAAWGRRT